MRGEGLIWVGVSVVFSANVILRVLRTLEHICHIFIVFIVFIVFHVSKRLQDVQPAPE